MRQVICLFNSLFLAFGLNFLASIPTNAGQTITGALIVNGSITGTSIGVGTYNVCNASGNCPSGGTSGTVTSITASSPLTGGTITTSGAIGINTTQPWNGQSGSALTAVNVPYSGLTGSVPIWNQNTTGQSATVGTISGLITNGANVTISGSGTSVSPYSIASSGSGGGSSSLWETNSVGIDTFSPVGIGSTTPGSALDVQGTVRSSLGAIFLGNVGIGTSTLNNLLTVVGGNVSIGTTSAVAVRLGINGATELFNNTTAQAQWTFTTLGGTSTQDVVFNALGAKDLSFGSNGGDRMVIDTGGNVGIGTFQWSNRLAVQGGEAIGNLDTNNFVNVAAPLGGLITEGNVGIGSNNPGQLLDVQGTARATSFANTNNTFSVTSGGTTSISTLSATGNITSSSGSLTMGGTGSNSNIQGGSTPTSVLGFISTSGTGTSDSFKFKVGSDGGTNAMTIQDQTGNYGIGIGTTVPGGILDVESSVRPAVFMAQISNLNVGIGSYNPGAKLDIQGTIRAISNGTCTFLYTCNGGVDAGVIQTSACNLCPGGTCAQMNGCF